MKAAELLVRCLEEEGIEVIFGVPGEENADFMLALEDSDRIRFVLTRHEQGAAFMAGVYGRLTGNPAACLGTLGPGSTNLITGVADANMDRSPMLVLTGQGSTRRLHKESHQIMDVVEMFQPVTKWATSIYNAEAIPEIVRKSVRVARSEKPGAVHIELPEDVAKRETEAAPLTPRRYRRPVPDELTLQQAVSLLRDARSPVIIAGNGAIRKRASRELRALCEKTGIGVLSTFMAKGAVDRLADYCLYTVGLGTKDIPTLAIDQADLVITVGVDMVEYHPQLWNPGGAKPILHIDFLPAEIDQHYSTSVELVGDVALSLEYLCRELEAAGIPEYELEKQREVRARMHQELIAHADDKGGDAIRPQKMLSDIIEELDPSDIVLSDVGAHKMWIARNYHCREPNTCLIPNGFCAMGFALPGAIAANLVFPERRVLAIAGDGGFLMNVQEMETARRLNSRIAVLVWEDGGYGLIGWKQEAEFGRQTALSFSNPDWLELADAFGWHGELAGSPEEFRDVLSRALAQDGPSLVVAPVDYRENLRLTERLGEIVSPNLVGS